jgi:hypothetical protein
VAENNQNGNGHPQLICEKCDKQMEVIGRGSASGRLRYRCECGNEQWGKNPNAAALGSLGGKARAEALSPEERSEQAKQAVEARWRKAKSQI